MTTIMDLPAELIISISSHLTTPELGLMRVSCKRIEQTLFDDFAKEFFTKRQFMIEHDSLNTLVAIANHPKLSAHLTEVLISTHRRWRTSNTTDEVIERRFNTMEPDHSVLIATGMARDLLREAFSKLPNLKSVGIRDFDGKGRIRDGPRARWRSWGWAAYPGEYLTIMDDASQLFALVVTAIGEACAQIPKVEVILRHTIGLQPAAFYIGTSTALVLAGLQRLMLDVGWAPVSPTANLLNDEPLHRFLAASPALETLRLNFGQKRAGDTRTAVLDWLADRVSSGYVNAKMSPVPPMPFDKLKRLDIGRALVSSSILLAVLTRFDLTSFSLWKVNLRCNLSRNHDDPDGLLALLTDLSARMRRSSVEEVTLGHIAQTNPSGRRKFPMNFFPDGIDPEDVPTVTATQLQAEIKYRAGFGMTVSQWLEQVAGRVWNPSMAPASVSADSDTEMDDSEDEGNNDDG